MIEIYNLLLSNIYLYICIIIVLLILSIVLFTLVSNKKNRNKIKENFIEAEKVDEEVEKIEENNSNNELELLLKKMQEDINIKPEDVVRKFEEEQEEKAIISYQELVDNVKAGKIEVIDDEETNTNFVENLDTIEEMEPIIESDTQEQITPEMVKEAIANISESSIKEEPKKFKNSAFISPVYGVMEDKLEYPTVKKTDNMLDLLNTKDYNKLTEEIQRQEEFLQALKEFRNNL